jgi:glycosyltransferase involved in cell wall biosynthesis
MGFKKELESLIEQLDMKNSVIFTGYIAGRDKLEYLVDCDVCVFPSRAEQGLPFAGLESVMCGTPIIVTDGTGSAEDVKKMNSGFVCSVEILDKMIDRVLNNEDNVREERTLMAQNYIRKNLSITEKMKDYEKVYEQVMWK